VHVEPAIAARLPAHDCLCSKSARTASLQARQRGKPACQRGTPAVAASLQRGEPACPCGEPAVAASLPARACLCSKPASSVSLPVLRVLRAASLPSQRACRRTASLPARACLCSKSARAASLPARQACLCCEPASASVASLPCAGLPVQRDYLPVRLRPQAACTTKLPARVFLLLPAQDFLRRACLRDEPACVSLLKQRACPTEPPMRRAFLYGETACAERKPAGARPHATCAMKLPTRVYLCLLARAFLRRACLRDSLPVQ